jgi:A/G-specific adenine glycosylase
VIKAWAGLGYNRRAVYLHKAAITVVSQFGGEFPRSEEELVRLPGVGRYTARAILAFAFGKDVGVLETNTKRVLLRIFFGTNSLGELKILLGKEASAHSLWSVSVSRTNSIPFSTATAPKGNKENTFSEKNVLQLADAVVPEGKGDHWNQALMDFGAMVCTAKRPKCEECPARRICNWFAYGKQPSYAKATDGRGRRPRFEETDRYFRGRIVDALRVSSLHVERLREYLEMRHGLSSRERFDRLITDLGSDGLIKVDSSRHVSLP